jgi:DNA-binding IclR family transcriptional regulator
MGKVVSHRGTPRKDPTFQRALEILLLFVEQPIMAVHALSERLAMRKSTAYRFVSGLRDRGFLDDAGAGQYRLGPRIFQLAEAARQSLGIVDLSVPVMEELAQATGETCLLTTVVADRALAVRQVAAPKPARLTFQPGVMRPLHAGASAKVLFAFLPDKHRERLLQTNRFERRTTRSVTDPVRLRRQLAQIRAQGYSVTTGEYEEALRAVAAPVIEPGGGVWGLSVVGPVTRMRDDRLSQVTRAVVAAANDLQTRLGGSRAAVASAGSLRGVSAGRRHGSQ